MNIPNSLKAYKFTTPLTVVWGDMDAMAHVNNTKYFRYLETARIEFLRQLFAEFAQPDKVQSKLNLALAEARCRFKVSLTHPDEIIIGTGISAIAESHFIVKHEIYSTKMDCIAAEGDARMVYFDFEKKQKVSFDRELLEKLQQYAIN